MIDDTIFSLQKKWAESSFEQRSTLLETFANIVQDKKESFARLISEETGKPLWESKNEVDAVSGKVAASIAAYQERCVTRKKEVSQGLAETTHKPLGVVAVLGPYNFPAHLPNGQIVPALLAGNGVIFKPSEQTPKVGTFLAECFYAAGLPKELLQLVQGGPEAGEMLVHHPRIRGIFFTGSFMTGKKILSALAHHPEKIVALEMGGNNPLVMSDVEDIDRAVEIALVSAFLSTGQRCSCARRLIVIEQEIFIEKFLKAIPELIVGSFDRSPEPFMGPLISDHQRERVLNGYQELLQRSGKVLLAPQKLPGGPFLTPGVVDMTDATPYDEEIFGPILQLYRVKTFEAAIRLANETQYGLTASLISDNAHEWPLFYHAIEAGVINWNTPTTGALAIQPFGGTKKSGNGRPGAFYMTDSLTTPVASLISSLPRQIQLPPGMGRN